MMFSHSTLLSTVLAVGLVAPGTAQQGLVHTALPDPINPESRYVFYLHGRIIETQGRRPTHPVYGVYEYDRVVQALATDGVQVISEVRPADTGIGTYSQKVISQINQLFAAGVPADAITVVGFSKGGIIAIAVSSLLDESEIRYVFLGACGAVVFDTPGFRLTGRVLSIYENSDEVGVSCATLFERSPDATALEEIRIDTGYRHGAFYEAREAWLEPTLRWINGTG